VICTIGSANMYIRSFSLNYEAISVIYYEEKAQELERDFLEDLKHCIEWRVVEYVKRSVSLRLRDSLARLASPLL
jgi:cardiolipin synthase